MDEFMVIVVLKARLVLNEWVICFHLCQEHLIMKLALKGCNINSPDLLITLIV